MNTTGIFKTHYYAIPVKNNEPVYLVPFGDVHRNAPLCSTEYWTRFLDEYRNRERTYFLGMGDYDDLVSASEREIFANKKIHESTAINLTKYAEDKVRGLCGEIEFMRGKIIGLLGGNHYWDFPSGVNSDQMMAQLLDTTYLGVSAFIRLSLYIPISKTGGTSHSSTVDIWAHHGKGAARLIGGSINRVAQMREAGEADIYIMGHDHRKGAVPSGSKLELVGTGSRLKVKHKTQWLVRSGSFLRGYVENEPSYVANGAMNPTDLGAVCLELKLNRYKEGEGENLQIEIHART